MKYFKLLILKLSLIFIILALFYKGYLRFNYPSDEEYPVQGLDISHHQGDIEWQELKKQKYKFIYMKATEGGDFKDHRFESNWENARNNGFKVGAYHFFTLCKQGSKQAQNFVNIVPNTDLMLPPAIDLEFGGNCSRRPMKDKVIKEIQNFAKIIIKSYGVQPILYVTYEFYEAYLRDANFGYKLWVRDIYKQPSIPTPTSWLFWQYANRGHVKGIGTYVDLNVFNGSLKSINLLIR